MLGALECELPNGKRFDVGSGFNMAQRKQPPKKGSVITFKFQELSNNGHPRFPVFLRMRADMTWNDVLEAAKTKKPMSVIQKIIPSAKLSKQHSVLFSVIPSRDASTGKKIVTSDDEDDEATPATSSSKTTDTRPICRYGAKCYRTNADHFKQYQHPSSTKSTADEPTTKAESTAKPTAAESTTKAESTAKPTTTESTTKIPCTFGAKCYRTSSIHLANYSHPPKSEAKDAVDVAGEDEVLDTRDLIEQEEPVSPTTTTSLLVKDKNKGITFDDDDDSNEKEEMVTRSKKEWTNLENKSKEQSKRLAHLEDQVKTTKRSTSTNDNDQDNGKRLKTD
jgi:hypothetical protein